MRQELPVILIDSHVYVLREEHGQWQVDDPRFEHGTKLADLLAVP